MVTVQSISLETPGWLSDHHRFRRVVTEIPELSPCYLSADHSGGPQSGILGSSLNPVSKTLTCKPSQIQVF